VKTRLFAAVLLITAANGSFRGVAELAEFSKEAHARVLAYFNNDNGIRLLDGGRILSLGLDTHLWRPDSCCAHRATPSLSRDGRRIAFVHLASTHPRTEAVAVFNVMTHTHSDVFSARAVWGISWSPDGRRLAVVADGQSGAGHNLYVIDLSSGSVRQLTYGELDLSGKAYMVSDYAPPSWNPTGTELALELRRTGPAANNSDAGAIVIWDLESGRFRKLADGVDPSWSPAGDRIAFFDVQRKKCFATKPDGSEKKLLFSSTRGWLGIGGGAPLLFPLVWSPDGSRVLWHEWVDADLVTEIYESDLKSKKIKHIGQSELQVVDWR
jgi:Tol biopolymer transport system component